MSRFNWRGKTVGGSWTIGYLSIIKEKRNIGGANIEPGYYISNSYGSPFAFQVRPETVGQSTGLFDVDGKEIFEGDIVDTSEGEMEIIFDNESACYAAQSEEYGICGMGNMPGALDISQIKIIGNVHEEGK